MTNLRFPGEAGGGTPFPGVLRPCWLMSAHLKLGPNLANCQRPTAERWSRNEPQTGTIGCPPSPDPSEELPESLHTPFGERRAENATAGGAPILAPSPVSAPSVKRSARGRLPPART